MKKLVILLLMLPALLKAQDIATKADEYLTAISKQKKFSGTVLIAKGGKVLLNKGYGWADAEKKVYNGPETEFRIGSVSKQFTATVIMKLAEEGKLKVTDPLTKFISHYPKGDSITIHHLLSQTSGIQNFTNLPEFKSKWIAEPATLSQTITHFKSLPLNFRPGEKYQYSNSNYILLSFIAEKAGEKPLNELLNDYIFTKAGMQNSGLDANNRMSDKKATGHNSLEGDKPQIAEFNDMSVPSGAGAMYATTGDLYRWDRALYSNKIINEDTKSKMFTINKGNYGYGWMMGKTFGHNEISHGGAISGFLSNIARFPADDACIIVLSNTAFAPMAQLTTALSAILFGEKYTIPAEKKIVKVEQKILDQYAGEYQLNPAFTIQVTTENGKIFGQATGQPKFEIFPTSNTEFFLKVVDANITFIKDEAGMVTEMILNQGGKVNLKKIR
ncbi:MAG TPA: serine hydrolase [Sphingobacteriaceae bacterium]